MRFPAPLATVFFGFLSVSLHAETPSASVQIPNVSELPDSTDNLTKQIADNDGTLLLAPGVHRITKTLEFNLEQVRSTIIRPESGPATLIMDGPGPAIRIVGSHQGSASPKTFDPATWNERMPIVEGIEIIGNHPEADGIELVRCVEPVVSRVSVRWCRHGVHLVERNRNVVISDAHLYENSGIGVFYDDVNLHQSNISNSHISYNRQGGIVVIDGNVRNVQITGCDIEANMPADDTLTGAANILLHVAGSADDKSKSIAEVAITGCTIQHSSNYSGKDFDKLAPGGADIRIYGKEIWPIDSVTISGNVVSDTSLLVDIKDATDVTVTGNTFFAPNPDFLHATKSKRLVIHGNTFNPRQFERPGRLIFDACQDCIVSDNTFRALAAEDGAVTLRDCQRIQMSSNILTESSSGVVLENSQEIAVEDWIVSGLPEGASFLTKDEASTVLDD